MNAALGMMNEWLVKLGFVSSEQGGPADHNEPDEHAEEPTDLAEQGSRMADWLPYRSYRAHDQIFINTASIGFMLELSPQTGADQSTADRLKGLYTRLPTDACMQIMLYASPSVAGTLREHANLRVVDETAKHDADELGGRPARNTNVFRKMARARYAHLNRGSQQPLVSGSGFLIRDFRLFVSVTLPGHINSMGNVDALLDIRDGIRSTLDSARFPNRVVTATDLISLVAEILNPARQRSATRVDIGYDEMNPLNTQCVDRDTIGDWRRPDRGHLWRAGGHRGEQVEVRAMSLQRTPKQCALWNMSAMVGDAFQDTLQIPCPFIITMGVHVPNQKDMGSKATAEKINSDRNATSDFAKYSPAMQDKNEDWSRAIGALEKGGKIVNCYHQIVLLAPPAVAHRAHSAIRDVWSARGFELATDQRQIRTGLLQALPMTLGQPMCADLQRLKRWSLRTSGNTIHMAPMIAEAKGTGTPTILGVGRRGQITTLDFFDNVNGGKCVSIVGSTGSGKSTLLQEIATAYASKGTKVRIFEAGRSFQRLTARVGGQFVLFNSDIRICVNPFAMVSEPREVATDEGIEIQGGIDDDVAMLQPMLAKMASPNQPLDPVLYATLATVIKEEYVKKGRSMTVTDVMRRYQEGRLYPDRPIDQRYYDMADMLAPFCEGGPYAAYFNGNSTLDFDNDWMVYEMQELSANPHLKGVVVMILLYKVTQEMLEERRRQKLFIMDEAKEALAGSGPDDLIQAQFLEKLYLRVRKYNGSAITASQDVAHWFESGFGKSIWNQSDFIILGKQSENSIEAIARGEAIKLDESLRRTLTSIGYGNSHFKEWYVHSGLFRGIIRSIVDPATLLLMSNRAEDNIPLDERLARGMTVTEAIEDLLRERGTEVAS